MQHIWYVSVNGKRKTVFEQKRSLAMESDIARSTELEWWFFANNSVIIASATMKLDQNLVRLTP